MTPCNSVARFAGSMIVTRWSPGSASLHPGLNSAVGYADSLSFIF